MPIIQGPLSAGRSAGPARAKPAATPASKVTYVLARPTAAGGAGAAYSGPSAADQAQSILGPQEAQQNLYAAHQNAVIQSFARSLLGKLQPVAGQVGADYNQAIQQIGGLSGQAAQYLSGQNPSAVQQALTSSVGAPPEQQAQEAAQLGNTFRGGAGVLAFTQGVVPGSELAGNKAAAQASARQLPGIAALKGQQDLASAMWQQSQDRAKLEATRPKLVSDAQSNIDTANYRSATLAQKAADSKERASEFYVGQGNKVAIANAGNQTRTAIANASNTYKYQALAATNVYRQGLLGDKAAARAETKAYHDSYLTHLQNGDSERVAHDKALEAAGVVRNTIAQQNANTSTTRANNAAIAQNNAQAPKYSASVSRSLGFRADQFGNPIEGGALLPGFTRGKNGVIVKTSTASPSTGDFTIGNTRYHADGTPIVTGKSRPRAPKTLSLLDLQKDTAAINAGLDLAIHGGNYDKNGKVSIGGGYDKAGFPKPPIDRATAITELRNAGYFSNPQSAKIAMAAINRAYGTTKGPLGAIAW